MNLKPKSKIYVDIDHTICETPEGLDYTLALPMPKRIDKINTLFDQGHTIVYWTARGQVTGIDWREVTEKQLDDWGVKRTDLQLTKPPFDLMIDDKCFNSNNYFNDVD